MYVLAFLLQLFLPGSTVSSFGGGACGACEMGLDVAEIGVGADLSLDLRCFASRAVRRTKDSPASSETTTVVDAYIRRLEEERGKIEVFRRELPLCARLLADVIDVMKEETEKKKKKKDDDDLKDVEEDGAAAAGDKSKWMSTAQLWTGGGAADPDKKRDEGRTNESCGGAFVPLKAVGSGACSRKDDEAGEVGGVPGLSSVSPPGIKSARAAAAADAAVESRRRQVVVGFARAAVAMAPSCVPAPSSLHQHHHQQQQQQVRKSRRWWSLELHRQFVAALNHLGGPQVATPKQIRELMKVDGLTNDEVKSHLQKYRLHNRRAPGPAGVVGGQQPIVVVGGLWIPHHHQLEQQQRLSCSRQSGGSPLGFSAASGVVAAASSSWSESYGWK